MVEQQHRFRIEKNTSPPPFDFEILRPSVEDLIITGNCVHILVSKQPRCECEAHVTQGRIYVRVRSIQDDGKRHPFFQKFPASFLLQEIVDYFERSQPVAQLAFCWQCPLSDEPCDRSDNYTAYIERKQELERYGLLPKDQRLIAAKATWTFNKVAIPLRFWHVTWVEEMEKDGKIIQIDGVFSR